MKTITVKAVVHAHPDDVYRVLTDFPGYVGRAPSIRRVDLRSDTTSAWEVAFRDGVLRWVERDDFDAANRTITFHQVDGDLEVFDGRWTVEPSDDGATVAFNARFDLGVPGLAAFLEPVAERALQDNITELITCLFGDSVLHMDTPNTIST
jgi:ribosome-associated toxin RatA of RatAB toxin-antitoxin module